MAYIGNTATTQAFTPAVDYFNGDGATVAFTLSKPVASVAQVQAVIENVPQNPGSAYTVSGNTITFTSAPPSGTANIYVYYTSPITQVIAPSQGTVGTSVLQDGSVTSAKLATLTTLPAPSSNTLTLPDASGTVVLDSATQTLTNKTIQGGTITSGTAVASTSGTSIDFTGIPSWVKRITVMFNAVSLSGTSIPLIQFGDSGGVETTGYVSVSSYTTGAAGAAVSSTSGFVLNTANAAGNANSGSITFSLLNSSTNLWTCSGTLCFDNVAYVVIVGGRKTLSDILTTVRITTVNGTDTFDAGSINILYE